MIAKTYFFRKKLSTLLIALFNKLENNNNASFISNGEQHFIDILFSRLNKIIGRKILLDVGANIGDYSAMLVDKSTNIGDVTIYAFEPIHSSFELLKNRFSGADNIILNNIAVSDTSGSATVFYDAPKSKLASLYKRNLTSYSVNLDHSQSVETIRLDSYIDRHKIPHIHFMKIDIEGHELSALKGLGSYLNTHFIDCIQFEYGGTNLDSHTNLMDLYTLFETNGFTIAKIMPKALEVRSYDPMMDNFQYANYVAISPAFLNTL